MGLKCQNPNFNILCKIAFWNKQKRLTKELIIWRDKTFDYMEPCQPDFTIPSQPGNQAGPLPYNCNPGRLAHQMR